MIAAGLALMRGRWHWLALAALVIALGAVQHSRANWKAKAGALSAWQANVREAASTAAGVNGTLAADDVVAQIHLLGSGLRECKGAVQVQTAAVLETAREGERLRDQSTRAAASAQKAEQGSAATAAKLRASAKAEIARAAPDQCETPADVLASVRGQ